ncbi:MAG: ADP-ribosylglycohydrolase family protein [Prochloraceae cyanobacterium]
MNNSILNRFTGASFGSYIGENLIFLCDRSRTQRDLLNWTKIGIDNSKIVSKEAKSARDYKLEPNWHSNFGSGEAAIMSLSELLLCYDDFDLLTEEVGKMGQYSTQIREDILIWGYALALACQQKDPPRELIDKIITKIAKKITNSRQTLLLKIQKHLQQNSSLQTFIDEISRQTESTLGAIALTIYCFATVPEDFSLCLKRAVSLGYQSSITGALTGAIAGAYNGISSIPISWRQTQSYQPDLEQINLHSRKLFAVWSGSYQNNLDRIDLSFTALAAANELQDRPFFQTISQKK